MSGCMCPDGLVSDGEGGCINETQCPCLHNGKLYKPGQTMQVDCNTWFVQPLNDKAVNLIKQRTTNTDSKCQHRF